MVRSSKKERENVSLGYKGLETDLDPHSKDLNTDLGTVLDTKFYTDVHVRPNDRGSSDSIVSP